MRELDEELGVELGTYTFERSVTDRDQSTVYHLYTVRRWRGEPYNRATEEHDEVRWVTVRELGALDFALREYRDLIVELAMA